MDAHAVVILIMGLVAAVAPFGLKRINLKGPAMAFFAFGCAAVIAIVAMVVSGDAKGIGEVANDPVVLAKYVAECWALMQMVYAIGKDRFLL